MAKAKLTDRFVFLKSNRFWAMVIAALSVYLQTKGLIGEPEMALIATISTGFTVLRTVDRFGEKSGSEDTK